MYRIFQGSPEGMHVIIKLEQHEIDSMGEGCLAAERTEEHEDEDEDEDTDY